MNLTSYKTTAPPSPQISQIQTTPNYDVVFVKCYYFYFRPLLRVAQSASQKKNKAGMQTEARVGVVVEGGGGGGGGQRVLNTGHGAVVVDAGAAHKLMEQQKERTFHNHQSQIGTVSQLLAGGVAGAVGKTCTAPLARLTILFQVQYFFYLFFHSV